MLIQKKGEWLEMNIPEAWSGLSVEQILKERWQASKGFIHRLRMEKGVVANGEPLSWKHILKAGDRIQIHLFLEEEYGLEPEYIEIAPIFEDDHLLIVNKPAGMDTHPSEAGGRHTLANAVASHWLMNGLQTKVRHIHRLDRDTTGGVIFAKHALAGAIMDRMLSLRQIKRTYIAFVLGIPKQQAGEIKEPIGRDRHHPTRRRVSPGGDHAHTRYKVLEKFHKHKAALVELQLETGRTHQIRVHMSHLGHPLLGDRLYGGDDRLCSRQALHAAHIQLPHPITEENLSADIPWPLDLLQLHQQLSQK